MRYGKMKRTVAVLLCLAMLALLPIQALAADLATPSLVSASASGSGIKVVWNAVSGAEAYRVYRKSGSEGWKAIANNVTGTSYKDGGAAAGTTYTYTVRCLVGGNLASGFDGKGVSASWTNSSGNLAAPKLSSAVASGSGIKVTWEAVSGAEGYRVYRKNAGTNWTAVADNVTATNYQDNSATAGVTYTYTVRCLKNGKLVSDFNRVGVSCAWTKATAGYLATPGLTSAGSENSGIRVKWSKVSGAEGYRIYRKSSGTNWTGVTDVGNVDNYLDTSVKAGVAYTYTVRCLKGGNLVSDFNKTGVSATWAGSSGSGITAPKLLSATAEGSGIRVTWQAVSGISTYRLYRKSGNSGWTGVTDVAATSYLDNATNSGVTYTYTVRCLDASGKLVSDFDKTGISGSWTSSSTGSLATPVLRTATVKQNSLVVTWDAVSGAAGYRVYRKTGNSSWVGIANVTAATYTDTNITSGVKYTYTVRALNSSGGLASGFNAAGISATFYSVPALTGANATDSGITVTWNAVAGAQRYLIFRRPASGTYSRLTMTTSTSFADTSVAAGVKYIYTVCVISSDGKTVLSDHDLTGIQGIFVGKVEISSLTPGTNGVQIQWNSLAGASKYAIYRKYGAGGWSTIATVTASNYVDASALNNISYTYTVRAMDESGKFIGTYDATGKSITYFATPTLIACTRTTAGLVTTWESVEGISNYQVLRKIGSGQWMPMGYSNSTNYTDTTMPSGTWCLYTVRCVSADGASSLSAYDTTGVGATSYMDIPALIDASNRDGYVYFTWRAVENATNYAVYRRTGVRESWIKVGTSSSGAYSDTTVVNGGTYYYTVAVCDGSGNELSAYNTTGVNTTYYNVPTLIKASNAANGVTVSWNAVDGIGSYRIYRKTGGIDWTVVGTSSATSFTDTDVRNKTTYRYTVCCLVNDTEVSEFNNTGVSTTFYSAPTVTGASNVAGGVTVTWNAVDGIGKYRVYRKGNGSNWTEIGDTTALSFKDTGLVSGEKYDYTVRCMEGSNLVSYFNSTASVVYIAAPAVTATSPEKGKTTLTWGKVKGATGYAIYRRTLGTTLTQVATVGDTASYTDTSLTSGSMYYYVVVATYGTTYRSANSTEVSVQVK